ncbi:MAG TPA: pyridoxamine 5'-phosphate oxidase [Cyclobacteriaceae bacterium]|nr:pyridoxamine 5'-phosphate oxidase [Cyclobacteriaceae bacterium]
MAALTDLRKEYAKAKLDAQNVSENPIVQFEKWFSEAQAAGIPEPNAMNLATVSGNGLPSSRIVLLKGVEEGKFIFYSNYQSQKGKELDENPVCALNFFWPELERQVRINGTATRISEDRSTQYFQSRPRDSQVGAWASPQSVAIRDRSIIEERVKEIEKRFAGLAVLPKPKQWGGYAVDPHEIEFWQGRPSRLHDRLSYTKVDNVWTITRLAP